MEKINSSRETSFFTTLLLGVVAGNKMKRLVIVIKEIRKIWDSTELKWGSMVQCISIPRILQDWCGEKAWGLGTMDEARTWVCPSINDHHVLLIVEFMDLLMHVIGRIHQKVTIKEWNRIYTFHTYWLKYFPQSITNVKALYLKTEFDRVGKQNEEPICCHISCLFNWNMFQLVIPNVLQTCKCQTTNDKWQSISSVTLFNLCKLHTRESLLCTIIPLIFCLYCSWSKICSFFKGATSKEDESYSCLRCICFWWSLICFCFWFLLALKQQVFWLFKRNTMARIIVENENMTDVNGLHIDISNFLWLHVKNACDQ